MPASQTRKSRMPQKQSAGSSPRSESLSSSQDIVGRLRTATGLDLDLKREAADEIERLRMTPDELHCLQQILLVNHVKCIDPLREFVQRQVSPQENSTEAGQPNHSEKPNSSAGDDFRIPPSSDPVHRMCDKALTQLGQQWQKKIDAAWGVTTLTDAEREAVKVARDAYADDDGNAECEEIAAVLSRLLERLGGER